MKPQLYNTHMHMQTIMPVTFDLFMLQTMSASDNIIILFTIQVMGGIIMLTDCSDCM